MASLMLVNPRKRRKHKAKAHKRRRRNPVANLNPRKRRHRRRRNPIGLNRIRRRARHVMHKVRRRRRNPIGGGRGMMKGLFAPVMPAAISAVGAIGLDLAWGMIGGKLPAALSTGPVAYAAKAVGALGLGALAGMVVKKDTANQLAIGALTVVFHGAMKEAINKFAPNVNLGDAHDYTIDGYPLDGMAEYLPNPENAMGEYLTEGIGYAGGGTYMGTDESMTDMGAVMPFSL